MKAILTKRRLATRGCVLLLMVFLAGLWGRPALADPPIPEPPWIVLNGGAYVDAGEAGPPGRFFLTSLVTDAGNLVYLFHSPVGTVMGRLTADKRWEIWSQDHWSFDPNVVPTPVDHALGAYKNARVHQHPAIQDALIGVANSYFRAGKHLLNVHGTPTAFVFDGTGFLNWKQGDAAHPLGEYDRLYKSALIPSFGNLRADFAYDVTTKTGVLVGNFNSTSYYGCLSASRYVYNTQTGVHEWHRWNRDSLTWEANNTWPSSVSRVAILDLDENRNTETTQALTHIANTPAYLLTFQSPRGTGSLLKAARLMDSDTVPTWSWWDGSSWQVGGNYQYQGIASIQPNCKVEQLYWYEDQVVGGRLLILYNNQGHLCEVEYAEFGAPPFTASRELAHQVPQQPASTACAGGFCVGVDRSPDRRVWLFYLDGDGRILLRTRIPGADWTTPQAVTPAATDVWPVGIDFVGPSGDIPVLFALDARTPTDYSRILAFSTINTFWGDEQPLAIAELPPIQMLDDSVLACEARIADIASSNMGIESLGETDYVYSPGDIHYGDSVRVCSFPRSAQDSCADWGLFWDHFSFPSGAAVDTAQGKVYIAQGQLGGGTTPWDAGWVAVWETTLRHQDCGWRGSTSACLSDNRNKDYYATRFPSNSTESYRLAYPSDLAVDATRNLLYVTDALHSRVVVFDVSPGQLVDADSITLKNGIFTSMIQQGQLQTIASLVEAMIAADPPLMYQVTCSQSVCVRWADRGLEGEIIPWLRDRPEFAQLALGGQCDDTDFLRNVREHYKRFHDHPLYLYTFGEPGSAAGQMEFPEAIDLDSEGNAYVVDCGNHRIQKWTFNPTTGQQEYAFTWGQLGRGPGEFLHPTGLAVDATRGVVYVADPLNDRVQTFDASGRFLYEWGAWRQNGRTRYLRDAVGLATNQAGTLYLGTESSLARFRVVNQPPALLLTMPTSCSILPYGSNTIQGSVADDYGVTELQLDVKVGATSILHRTYDFAMPVFTAQTFELQWELPSTVPMGTPGRIEVRAHDEVGALFAVLVWLGGEGSVADGDQDGVPDGCDNCPYAANTEQADCDHDGLGDVCALAGGVAQDCNVNAIPDACDIVGDTSLDLNHNSAPDECEDCNGNGIPDELDLPPICRWDAMPPPCSADCNQDGIPDECSVSPLCQAGQPGFPPTCDPDCNTNGVPDACDQDCDLNGLPDDCEDPEGRIDCDNNGVWDACDIYYEGDCNSNGVVDRCEVPPLCQAGQPGFPQECSSDCNGTGYPDWCDIVTEFFSSDCNLNAIPDECDLAGGASYDQNESWVPDECERGDLNCDGLWNTADVRPFTLALTNPSTCESEYPGCDCVFRADMDEDEDLDLDDVPLFVAKLLAGGPVSPPLHAKGDMNCDDTWNTADVRPFTLALTDAAGYEAAYPNCDIDLADMDGDGDRDLGDMSVFVAKMMAAVP